MRVEEFLGLLKGVTPSGDGWVACCPAHGDEHASMSVKRANDGGVVLHCHAGCATEDVVAALGLQMKDLFADSAPSLSCVHGAESALKPSPAAVRSKTSQGRQRGTFVCNYVYHDAEGNELYRSTRFAKPDGGKFFQLSHRDGSAPGGWAYGLQDAGIPRLPYRLPDVVKAAKAGSSVIVCEGEKDVDNVRALGYAATCNVAGAGKWGYNFPSDWGKWFNGVRGVLIIADNDPLTKMVPRKVRNKDEYREVEKPFAVGQLHALDVARQLRAVGFAGTVKIMTMPKVGETSCKDFTDWLDALVATGVTDPADVKARFAQAVSGAMEPDAFAQAFGLSDSDPKPVASDDGPTLPVEEEKSIGSNRFGEEVPRAPESSHRCYKVDFRTGGFRAVEIRLDQERILYTRTSTDAAGNEKKKSEWRKLPLSVMIVHAGWMVRESLGKDGKMSTKMQSDIASVTCLMWLRSRGKFFWDENAKGFQTSLYFDETTGILMRVRSDEFAAFIATAAEMNRESSGFKYLMSLIDDAAMNADVSMGVVPSNMWDRRGDAVYISSGDAEMYRVKGGSVELVQNGTDGVLFMRGKTLAPWKLEAGAGVDPFKAAKIFTNASWESPAVGAMNVRLWVLNLFACHATKPILLMTGLAQSGKTRMAKAIKEILGVRAGDRLDLSVQTVEDGDKGLDAFWATVNDGKLEVFDNLDTKVKWVGDALQNVATDGQTKRRTLYTTFGVSILRANANIILTSNNPMFSTEGAGGMADRIITINLLTNRKESMDTELSEDIKKNRDSFMTWLARTVSCALSDDKPVDKSINRRHPDYGIFSVRCGRAFGDEQGVVRALTAAEVGKALLPLRNDFVTREILRVLEDEKFCLKFTGGEMSARIVAKLSGDEEPDEKTRLFYSSRKVGKAIARFARQFEFAFDWIPPRTIHGSTVYETRGLKGGLVDLDSAFGESSIKGAGVCDFTQNTPQNPPTHPCTGDALARAPSLSLSREEEESIESTGSELDSEGVPDDLTF